jgi:hypothetical protein
MSNEPEWGERKPMWHTVNKGPRPKSIYVVPVARLAVITEHLGAVQERADGRWDWWRHKTYFFKFKSEWTTGQGVAPSKDAATIRVLEGWD